MAGSEGKIRRRDRKIESAREEQRRSVLRGFPVPLSDNRRLCVYNRPLRDDFGQGREGRF